MQLSNGHRFASATLKGFEFWDLAHQPPSLTCERYIPTDEVYAAIKKNPDSDEESFVFANGEGDICLLNASLTSDGEVHRLQTRVHGLVTAMTLFEDGSLRFATGDNMKRVLVWQWVGPRAIQQQWRFDTSSIVIGVVPVVASKVESLLISTQDGIESYALLSSKKSSLRWSLSREVRGERCKMAKCIGDQRIVTTGEYGGIQVLDLEGRSASITLKIDYCISSVVIALRNDMIAIGDLSGAIHICALSNRFSKTHFDIEQHNV